MKRIAKGSYGYGHSYGYGGHNQEDRLSSLSDDLLIQILSHMDTKLAVQSSILSKRWANANLWPLLPVLNFNLDSDYCFVDKVLSARNNSIMIDRFNIKVSDHKTVSRVLVYALSHGVCDLSIDCSENLDKYRPISCVGSTVNDSLINLSLKGMLNFGKFPSFVNLVRLRLERVKMIESDPFSCFPNLGELYLVNCKMETGLNGLEVIASRLSRLSISSCFPEPVPYSGIMLSTPMLVLFEIEGLSPMAFEVVDELRCLHTVHVDLYSNQRNLNLIYMLGCFKNAECVHLSPSTVKLLSLSESMLVKEHCPFDNLKLLNLIPPPNKPAPQLDSFLAAYLLKDCPRAVVKAMPR